MLKARKYREVQGSNERQEFRGKRGGRQGLGKSKNDGRGSDGNKRNSTAETEAWTEILVR